MRNQFPWIALEGCIGAGKTTIARLAADILGIGIELEEADKHPFLEDFYREPKETALQTELVFVLMHYHQITWSIAKRQRPIISDFTLAKDLLFAHLNLSGNDLKVFLNLHEHLMTFLEPPTLLVSLRATDDLLWHRVKLRDHPFERTMPREYLRRVNAEYANIVNVCKAERVLTLDSDDFDVVNSESDAQRIIEEIAVAANLRGANSAQ
jgi:deoxyadenosine/deoxycytidine kinase